MVLIHGLWMHGWVMELLAMRLRRCGLHPICFSYPSMRSSLSQNARMLSEFVAQIAAPRVHFIGHSLGGLLILQMLAEFPQSRVGRIILAGSPYTTSCVADKLARIGPGRHILGRSMLQWLGQKRPVLSGKYQIGAIAGAKSIGGGRLISRFTTPNDGVVTVDETRVPGIADHIVLNITHSQMLLSAELAREACSFLQHGSFTCDLKPSRGEEWADKQKQTGR